jgi:hypothetical protein
MRADELITTELPRKPIYRTNLVQVVYLYTESDRITWPEIRSSATGGHDAVHPQILNDLAIVICDVPHRDHRNSEARARPGIASFHPSERVLKGDRRQHFVAVIERIAQLLDQLGFGGGL